LADFGIPVDCGIEVGEFDVPVLRDGLECLPHISRLEGEPAGDREDVAEVPPSGEMLLDRFAGTPEDELLDRLVASPALAGPELDFLRARIAERRGDVSQAATLVTRCLKQMPGRQAYLDFAVKVDAELPSRARLA
jgi:hypothetical protein